MDTPLPHDANELKSLRPDLRKSQFYCVKCRKEPHLWAHYGLHIGGCGGQSLSGEGLIHGLLECHGAREEIAISFSDAAGYIARGEKIPVFDNVNQRAPKNIIGPDGNLLT